MTEDKQAILNAFLPALQLTRAGKDVVKLTYSKDTYAVAETVRIEYADGGSELVSVAIGGGIAMIQDVARAVMYG